MNKKNTKCKIIFIKLNGKQEIMGKEKKVTIIRTKRLKKLLQG